MINNTHEPDETARKTHTTSTERVTSHEPDQTARKTHTTSTERITTNEPTSTDNTTPSANAVGTLAIVIIAVALLGAAILWNSSDNTMTYPTEGIRGINATDTKASTSIPATDNKTDSKMTPDTTSGDSNTLNAPARTPDNTSTLSN